MGLLVLGLATVVAVWGHDYYRLNLAERPFHLHHNLLRPSGRMGLTFGVFATALFVLNLGYLVRKRLINIRRLGSSRIWMSFHAVTGITGGALIVLHSAFAPSSALAILALVALGITLLTGIIGRYLYAKIPRSLEGWELEQEQVRERLHACRHQLEDAGVRAEWLRPRSSAPGRERSKGFFASVRIVLRGREVSCAECHPDHAGPEFQLVSRLSWGGKNPNRFDHSHVRFTLAGAHENLDCEACHRRPVPWTLPDFPGQSRQHTYLGLTQECADCHEDVHGGTSCATISLSTMRSRPATRWRGPTPGPSLC